jgi:K+-sensing histidine kinase KdpD
VIACLTAGSSSNSEVLCKARVAARENDGEFYAVPLDSSHHRFGKPPVHTLIDDAVLASCFGAKIVWLESSDVAGELLQFARQAHVGRIFIARDRPTPFYRLFARTVYSDLLLRGKGVSIDVVGLNRELRFG